MKFTYEAYEDMLERLIDKGYKFTDYKNWETLEKTVILRHDVDNSLKKAAVLSKIEKDIGESATYFILLSTNFYNVHSRESRGYIDSIIQNGGNIGLHFDEAQYSIRSEDELKEYIYKEADMLSKAINIRVDVVSMHRPSKEFLSADMSFVGLINSYNGTYFRRMKYLSDSRRYWRENVDEIIEKDTYQRLHILTHPFWYGEREMDLKGTLKEAILGASLDYYDNLNDNFRNLNKEIEKAELERMIHK